MKPHTDQTASASITIRGKIGIITDCFQVRRYSYYSVSEALSGSFFTTTLSMLGSVLRCAAAIAD